MLQINPRRKARYGHRSNGGHKHHNRASCAIASLFNSLNDFDSQRHEHRERKRGQQEIFGRIAAHAKNRDPFIQHAIERIRFSQGECNTDHDKTRKNQLQSFSRGEYR